MTYFSKIYSNAVAKHNEGKLLGGEKIRRLMEAEFSDAVKMLADYGYGGGSVDEKSYDVDNFISLETNKLIEFVKNDCPGEELKNCLLNKFLYSDAKVYYKMKFIKIEKSSALYGGFEEVEKAIETNDFSPINEFLQTALISLNEKFAEKEPSPKEIDVELTKAMYKDNLFNAKKSHNNSLMKYIKTEIDFANILVAFRYRKLNISADKFEWEMIEGGLTSEEDLNFLITAEKNAIIKQFSNSKYVDLIDKLLETDDFAIFERDTVDILYEIMSGDSENMLSYSPFINYFMSQMAEFKTIKTILVCLKNNAREEMHKRIWRRYD